MAYQRIFRKDGKFSYALQDGSTVFVRNPDRTVPSEYNPSTHSGAAQFLATNPDLADRAAEVQLIINWDGVVDGLVTNAALWDIMGRYQGLNLSPRKQLSATSTGLMLVRLPGVVTQFIASWNAIITEIRANIIAVRPTATEITSINTVLIANNAPFRMDANGFFAAI